MQLRQLGNTDISIAPLALGGNVFGWTADKQRSFELLDAFVDGGFNLIDTADNYSHWVPGNEGGESESIIGEWLKRSGKREQVVIATKVAKWERRRGLSAKTIRAAAEDSLKRLGVEQIDLYFSHEFDADVPQAETLGAYARLIEEGKVRAIGASNFSATQLADALDVSAKHKLPRYEVLQPQYNLIERKGYEAELEPLAREHHLGVISYFALASGFLTGKYRDESDLEGHARGGSVQKYLNAHGKRILRALDDVAKRHDAQPVQIALAWLMARPGLTAPIASATTVEQLGELMDAASLKLGEGDIEALDNASANA